MRDKLAQYGLEDPNEDTNDLPDSIGIFTGEEWGEYFTTKFEELTARGSISELEALYDGQFHHLQGITWACSNNPLNHLPCETFPVPSSELCALITHAIGHPILVHTRLIGPTRAYFYASVL